MKKLLVVLSLFLFLTGTGNAELITIGSADYDSDDDGIVDVYNLNLIWDPDNNGKSLVWLDLRNAGTNWNDQNTWVAGLDSTLDININSGYSVSWTDDSWRMPNAAGGNGYNKTESEMGHLYYTELGNSASSVGGGLKNTGDFDNLKAAWYWTGTAYAGSTKYASDFNTNSGRQWHHHKTSSHYVLAVRTAQVTVVPEPGTLLLLGSGLLGIAGVSRRRKGTRC